MASPRSGHGFVSAKPAVVADLLARLAPLPAAATHPALILLTGPPGVGKSSFARLLEAAAPLAVVSSDAVRKWLYPTPQYDDREHIRVFVYAFALLAELLRRGISTVFDATNLHESGRRKAYRIAAAAGARLAVVRLTAPEAVVQQRMERRAADRDPWDRSDATFEVYQALAATEEPLRRPHLLVDTAQDFTDWVRQLAAFVNHPESSGIEPPCNAVPAPRQRRRSDGVPPGV
ncbi:MAG: ATP-binding protein [Chloroflexota bacterium]